MEYCFVAGRSMEPYLNKKVDMVVIDDIKIEDVWRGDIIAFRNKNDEWIEGKTNVICHRVIHRYKKNGEIHLIEKGDYYLDSSVVNKSNYIGKVIRVYKGKRELNLDDKKIKGINLMLAILSSYYDRKYKIVCKFRKNEIQREEFLKNMHKASLKLLGKLEKNIKE